MNESDDWASTTRAVLAAVLKIVELARLAERIGHGEITFIVLNGKFDRMEYRSSVKFSSLDK